MGEGEGQAMRVSDGCILAVDRVDKQYPLRWGARIGVPAATGGRTGGCRTFYALRNVSFCLVKGMTTGCVGESGCGKSTLARIMLLLEQPTAGSIVYKGAGLREATSPRPALREFRREVQPVFQDPYSSLPPRMSIRTVLTEPFAIHGRYSAAERRSRTATLLELVGLPPDIGGCFPHELSGGQRQRVAIARALALGPAVLVCDEPVSSLDVSVQAQVLNLLTRLQGELALTCFFISHDLRVVRYVSHYVMVMYLGRVVEYGRSDDLFRDPLHPYTRMLLRSIPRTDGYAHKERRLSAVSGEASVAASLLPGCAFYPRCPERLEVCSENPPPWIAAPGARNVACHRCRPQIGGSRSVAG